MLLNTILVIATSAFSIIAVTILSFKIKQIEKRQKEAEKDIAAGRIAKKIEEYYDIKNVSISAGYVHTNGVGGFFTFVGFDFEYKGVVFKCPMIGGERSLYEVLPKHKEKIEKIKECE
jgi:hypothetical protein